jgi:hypothetical protein
MVTVIATIQKFYNTTKYFNNINIEIKFKNLPHRAGLKTSIFIIGEQMIISMMALYVEPIFWFKVHNLIY